MACEETEEERSSARRGVLAAAEAVPGDSGPGGPPAGRSPCWPRPNSLDFGAGQATTHRRNLKLPRWLVPVTIGKIHAADSFSSRVVPSPPAPPDRPGFGQPPRSSPRRRDSASPRAEVRPPGRRPPYDPNELGPSPAPNTTSSGWRGPQGSRLSPGCDAHADRRTANFRLLPTAANIRTTLGDARTAIRATRSWSASPATESSFRLARELLLPDGRPAGRPLDAGPARGGYRGRGAVRGGGEVPPGRRLPQRPPRRSIEGSSPKRPECGLPGRSRRVLVARGR